MLIRFSIMSILLPMSPSSPTYSCTMLRLSICSDTPSHAQCWLVLLTPARCCSVMLRCCSVVVPLLFRCCSVLFRCCSVVVPLLFRCCSVVVPLLFRCCSVVVPFLFRFCSVVVPLLSSVVYCWFVLPREAQS